MLGNGQRVDLLKLFLSVREKGGYDSVSKNGLWDTVAAELGLDSSASPAVKLVFTKYLHTVRLWLERILKDDNSDGGVNSSGLLMDIKEFNTILSGISDQNKKDDEYPDLDLAKIGLKLSSVGKSFGNDSIVNVVDSGGDKRCADVDDNGISCLVWSGGNKRCVEGDNELSGSFELNEGKMCSDNDNDIGSLSVLDGGNRCVCDDSEAGSSVGLDGGKKCVDDEEDVIILNSAVANKEKFSSKRKRGSFKEMLNWVTQVAKDPCDSVIKMLPERSRWKFNGGEEYWKQVLLTREALFFKRPINSIADESIWQRKQKMHPFLYDDHIGSDHQLTKVLRCSRRLLSLKKSQAQPCSDSSSSGSLSDLDMSFSPATNMEDSPNKRFLRAAGSAFGLFGNNHSRKRVPMGPFFQAEVPEWTGVASKSDSKWLGSQDWPQENSNSKFLIERDRIGKGRQDLCGCQVPNSVECVRFHTAETRIRLKLELDLAFYSWKFDKMGESVALSWTEEDKKKLEATVRSCPPSHNKCFWDEIFDIFHSKRREDLVSYYFNVFLLQRRGYQNRYTPCNINSDDERESQYRSSTNGLAHEAD